MRKLVLLFYLFVLSNFEGLGQDTLSVVAKKHFYKAFHSSNYETQIEDYTKCLELSPKHAKSHYTIEASLIII